ncbi:MAG: TRAP transporter substrate-binding protein [Clostridiales Family XIII bacterium]|jgi:TRAP-type C4-dicarboxylate transport system substrate-binding protein|nr:TRAP transporter substrate-binding protein [Clostridiales Family XIII bacterium]
MKGRKWIKTVSIALVLTLMALTIAACGRPSAGDGESAESNAAAGEGGDAGEPIIIKVGHTDTGDRSTNQSILWLADYMNEQTNGRVVVEAYPDGQLGDDPEMCKGLLLGTDQVYFGLSGVLGGIVGPKLDILDLPFLFNSYDEWEAGMFAGGGLSIYNELLEGSGYVCVDLMYNGMMNLCSSKKVYKNSADMAGYKVRVTASDLNVKIFEAIGASPTPMSWGEVYTSVVQGTVDGLTHSLGVFNDFSFWEYAPYITVAEIQSSPYTVVMSVDFLDSLPADIKEIFLEGVRQACAQQRATERELELSYIDKFEQEGATVYALTPEEKAAFYDKCKDIYAAQREVTGADVFDRFLQTAGK